MWAIVLGWVASGALAASFGSGIFAPYYQKQHAALSACKISGEISSLEELRCLESSLRKQFKEGAYESLVYEGCGYYYKNYKVFSDVRNGLRFRFYSSCLVQALNEAPSHANQPVVDEIYRICLTYSGRFDSTIDRLDQFAYPSGRQKRGA